MSMRPKQNLSVRKIDDEVFIYDREQSFVHTFNKSGAFLWLLLEQGVDEGGMVLKLMGKYDISETSAQQDVKDFVGTLRKARLVEDVVR